MAFQPVLGTAEVIVRSTLRSLPVVNTFYVTYPPPLEGGDLEEIAAIADDWVTNGLKGFWANNVVYSGVTVTDLAVENAFSVVDNGGAGTSAGTATTMNNGVCLAVKRTTGRTGRSARGRVYIAGLPGTAFAGANNFVTQNAADTLVTLLNNFRVVMAAAAYSEVIVSRWSGGVKREAGVTFAVSNYQVSDLRIDSRRDRMPD